MGKEVRDFAYEMTILVPYLTDSTPTQSFMSYPCDNVLGQLFRVVSHREGIEFDDINHDCLTQIEEDPVFKPCSRSNITRGLDQRLCRIVVPQYFLKLAGDLKVQYDLDLWHILLR
jgi:hypothetical protein